MVLPGTGFKNYRKFFPNLVSYNRFVELMPYTALPMVFFAHSRCGKCTGISFADSTTIDVCDSHRIQQHRVFKDIAQRGGKVPISANLSKQSW